MLLLSVACGALGGAAIGGTVMWPVLWVAWTSTDPDLGTTGSRTAVAFAAFCSGAVVVGLSLVMLHPFSWSGVIVTLVAAGVAAGLAFATAPLIGYRGAPHAGPPTREPFAAAGQTGSLRGPAPLDVAVIHPRRSSRHPAPGRRP